MSEPPPTDVTSPPPGRARRALRNRTVRITGTVVVTGAAVAYLVSKIDLGKTAHIMATASPGWLALSAFLTIATVPPQALRWQLLLRARGVEENVPWLTRAYFVSYAVGQVLPTGVGGDASRIYETTRRHPGAGSPIAGSVVLERAIGGAVTLVLVAVGLPARDRAVPRRAVPLGRGVFVVGTIFAGVVVFSARLRRHLRRGAASAPGARGADRAAGLRGHPRLPAPPGTLLVVAGITTAAQLAGSSPSGPGATPSGSSSRSGRTSCSGRFCSW